MILRVCAFYFSLNASGIDNGDFTAESEEIGQVTIDGSRDISVDQPVLAI